MIQLYDVDWLQEPMRLITENLWFKGIDYTSIYIHRDSLNNELYHSIIYNTESLDIIIEAINEVWLTKNWRAKNEQTLCFSDETCDYCLRPSEGRVQRDKAIKGLCLTKDQSLRIPMEAFLTSYNPNTKTFGTLHIPYEADPIPYLTKICGDITNMKYRIGHN